MALQCAYIGSDEERPGHLATARQLIAEFKELASSPTASGILALALDAAEAEDFYKALQLVKKIVKIEDIVNGGLASQVPTVPVISRIESAM